MFFEILNGLKKKKFLWKRWLFQVYFSLVTAAVKAGFCILIRESLLHGKDQYGLPPCTIKFESAAFNAEKFFLLFYKNKPS